MFKIYDSNTFEDVLDRMLGRIPDTLDKREGSVIYDALAPTALEVSALYSYLEYLIRQSFISTADKEYLELLAEPFIDIKKATKSQIIAIFKNSEGEKIDIPIGARFSVEKLDFIAKEKERDGVFLLECEQSGKIGNITSGSLIPIEYIENLATAEITSLIKEAFDDEDEESLRTRLLKKLREPATSGNIYHYMQWAREVEGVGEVKVFPLHSGAGTVKILILNRDNNIADHGLISQVRSHIEEVRPIGASVTVGTARVKNISVSVNIINTEGSDVEVIKRNFREALEEYFKSISFKAEYVSNAKVGNILLSTPEVLDYSNLRLLGSTANIPLNNDEVPMLSGISISGR